MSEDPELIALSTVCNALSSLNVESQQRVLDYAARKFGLASNSNTTSQKSTPVEPVKTAIVAVDVTDDTDGVSPVALKWMQRNNLTIDQLGHIFSLGAAEIDLVSKTVPGNSKNTRTRSVVLLKGIAAYLSSGVPRITAEQIKEACLHYDAFDSGNHARYLGGMSAEATGSKASGYTLTARGITAATELIRELLGTK